MRLNKQERAAAMAVAAMTVTVVGAGIKLVRRHTRYVMQKATAFFDAQEREERPENAQGTAKNEELPQENEELPQENP